MTREDLVAFARALYNAKIFTMYDCDNERAPLVFMPLMFGVLAEVPREKLDMLVVYEYMTEAGPVIINGFPIFTSIRLMLKSDFLSALNLARQMEQFDAGLVNPLDTGTSVVTVDVNQIGHGGIDSG